MVQQRPVEQGGRRAGVSARLDEGRAAERDERILEQDVDVEGVGNAVKLRRFGSDAGEPEVEVAPAGVDIAVMGFQLDGDVRMGGHEADEPGQQPFLGDPLD